MPQDSSNHPTDSERLARLERAVFWHKVGWGILLTAFVGYLIPPIGGIIGLGLIVALIAGSVIVFITLVISLLDRIFPNKRSE